MIYTAVPIKIRTTSVRNYWVCLMNAFLKHTLSVSWSKGRVIQNTVPIWVMPWADGSTAPHHWKTVRSHWWLICPVDIGGWAQWYYTMHRLIWLMIHQRPWRDQWLICTVFIDEENTANSAGKDHCKGVWNSETETNVMCPEGSFLQLKGDIHHMSTVIHAESFQNKGSEETGLLTSL